MKTFERTVVPRARMASVFFAGLVSTLLFGLLALTNHMAGGPNPIEPPTEPTVIAPAPPDAPEVEQPRVPESPKEAVVVDAMPDHLPTEIPPAKLPPLRAPGLTPKSAGSLASGAFWASDWIFDSGDLDERPAAVQRVTPDYPYDKKINKVSGWARVIFVVDELGQVRAPEIEAASDRDFAEAALNAIRNWRFSPGRKDGKAVLSRMRQQFTFSTGR